MKTKSTIQTLFLLAALLFIVNGGLYAKNVTIEKAKNVALNIYTERSGKPLKNVTVNKVIEIKEKGETCLYVMLYSTKGFAVISADDIVQPVLGYSFESYYDENNLSPEFEFFVLKRLRKQIYECMRANLQSKPETLAEWSQYSASPLSFQPKGITSAFPLLTSVWHQRWPYNALCPVDTNSCNTCNDHVPVGCVATAMAQVLNYWHHPWHGTGSHSYTPDSHPEYGVQSANFGTTYYNFDNMPDTATTYSEDLAELCYHCGVAVDMDYGPDGSGAWPWIHVDDVSDALKNYFYFNNNATGWRRSSHSTTWVDDMKENLDADRPIIYAGYDNDEDAGHAWVLDAYTTGDMFHCNWGWGGDFNGFFSIDDFSVNGYSFEYGEIACIKIYPKRGTLSGTLTLAGSPYTYNYDQYVNSGSQLIIEPGVEIIFNGRYKMVVRGQLLAEGVNGGFINFNAQVPEIGMQGVMFENLNDNSMDSSKLVYCRFENGKGSWDRVYRSEKGGSVYCDNSAKVLIDHTSIMNSKAVYGGGIACYDSSGIRISHSFIRYDTAVMGGGVYLSNSDVVFSENDIRGNYTYWSSGGGVYCSESDAEFFKDVIRNNHGHFTGGVGINESNVVMDSVSVYNNSADNYGGGISVENSSALTINNSEVSHNTSGAEGGAMFNWWNTTTECNNVLFHHNQSAQASVSFVTSDALLSFTNCTLSDNYSTSGVEVQDTSTVNIKNSILWKNGSTEIVKEDVSSVNASYSIIKNNTWSGVGVTGSDPLLDNDYHLTWHDFPIPDGEKSAAIDAGDPASPNDPDGTRADMGCFPYEQIYSSVSGGDVSGTWTCANSPYYVYGDITVPSGDELIIEPCVTVLFRGDYKFEVLGRLLAEGTEADRITFASADTLEGWQGIRFINTSTNGQDSSKLVNCRITFGNADGSFSNDKRGGALFFSNAGNVLVSNCLLNKNKAEQNGGAIYSTGSSGPLFIDNVFEDNYAPTGGAFYGNSTGNLYFTNNLFLNNRANNGGALSAYSSNIYLAGNTIRQNRAGQFGGAIYYASGGNFLFDEANKNNIYLNYAGGAGLDLYYDGYLASTDVIVDTFTVLTPNKHFAYPLGKFNLTLDNYKIEQSNLDLYVSMTGSDENTGTSPAEPLKTLYMACMKIQADESNPRTIHLANGVYSEGATGEIFPVNWRSYVSMRGESADGVTIYGEDKNQLLFCYHDSGFSIDSITFQGGYGEYGGAIRLENGSSPTISNITVKENYAVIDGGGIYCKDHSSPGFYNVEINNNTCDVDGGGIKCYSYSNASFINSTILDNFALYRGGGICARFYSDIYIDTLNIFNNTAVHGGGLYISWGSDAQVKNTMIMYNDALSQVSGYFGTGGGFWVSHNSYPVFENVDVVGNHSDSQGGGVYLSGGLTEMVNCQISNNTSNTGGGMYLSGDVNMFNALIQNNTAVNGNGGGISSYGSTSNFTNVTIAENTVTNTTYYSGGAIYNSNSDTEFHNSILWNNDPDEIDVNSGTLTVDYSDVKGSYSGTGNIDSDPLFQYYRLHDSSPCIDAGNPDTTGMNIPLTDLDGNPRIFNGIIDMGAYEYNGLSHSIEVDIHVMLEGAFNGTDMNPSTNSDLPLSQPYNTPPWNYSGMESVASIPPGVVDWVLIELRDAAGAGSAVPSTMIARRAGFLLTDGTVVDLDGTSYLLFNNISVSNSIYFIVWHRNHLGIMSSIGSPLAEIVSVNFPQSDAAVYNSSLGGYKELVSGVWGMVAGDANGDGDINATDKTAWETDAGTNGYEATDFNFDFKVDNQDKNDLWLINSGDSSQVPE